MGYWEDRARSQRVSADQNIGTERGYGRTASDAYLSRATNFDASNAVNTYARGAYGSISAALGRQLRDLSGQAVGAGRFDSGFYDEDQGVLVNNATQQLNDAIAQQSVNAAGLDLRNTEGLGQFGTQARENAYDLSAAERELSENTAREEAARKRRRRAGIGSAIGTVLGAGAGLFLGGPGAVSPGARIGSGLGGSIAGG